MESSVCRGIRGLAAAPEGPDDDKVRTARCNLDPQLPQMLGPHSPDKSKECSMVVGRPFDAKCHLRYGCTRMSSLTLLKIKYLLARSALIHRHLLIFQK